MFGCDIYLILTLVEIGLFYGSYLYFDKNIPEIILFCYLSWFLFINIMSTLRVKGNYKVDKIPKGVRNVSGFGSVMLIGYVAIQSGNLTILLLLGFVGVVLFFADKSTDKEDFNFSLNELLAIFLTLLIFIHI